MVIDNMYLLHWSVMDGLLHLVQWWMISFTKA